MSAYILLQVIFTTELLYSDSNQAATQDSKTDSSKQNSKISSVSGTGEGISMETDACITDTISADTEARTNEGRPSKIVFKDYYADSVRHCLLGFRINLCSMLSE